MATYLALHALVTDEEFHKRLAVAMWRAAGDVFTEPAAAPDHEVRQKLAMKVITGGVQTPTRVYAIAAVQTPAVFQAAGAVTDAQLQNAVDNLFTIFAKMEARHGS